MKCFAFALVLLTFAPATGTADECLNQVGRWGRGPSTAVAVERVLLRTTVVIGLSSSLAALSMVNGQVVSEGTVVLDDQVVDVALRGSLAFAVLADGSLAIFRILDQSQLQQIGDLARSWKAVRLAVAGEFVYLAANQDGGLRIVDVSEPANPFVVGATARDAHDVVVDGFLAYTIGGGGPGYVDVFNVSNPTLPAHVGFAQSQTPAALSAITKAGDYLYVDASGREFEVFDTSTPTAPVSIAEVVFEANSWNIYAYDVAVSGDTALVAADRFGLHVIDISNPMNPVLVQTLDIADDAEAVVALDSQAFIAANESGVRILSVSDPTQLTEVSVIAKGGSLNDVLVDDELAFVSVGYGDGGLLVLDVSQPDSPSEVGRLTGIGSLINVEKQGDLVYLSAGGDGIKIVDVSTPRQPWLVGEVHSSHWSAFEIDYGADHLYVAGGNTGLRIVNVAHPPNPYQVWFDANSYTNLKVKGLDLVGNFLYYVQSESIPGFGFYQQLRILDVSDPAAPVFLGNESLTSSFEQGVAVAGDVAYVSGGGLWIVDVSNRSNPTTVVLLTDPPFAGAKSPRVFGDLLLWHNNDGLVVADIRDPIDPQVLGAHIAGGNADVVGDRIFLAKGKLGMDLLEGCWFGLFSDDFESGSNSAWSATINSLADQFNHLLADRGIDGDYIACQYDLVTGDFTYLGQVFNQTDGGLGGLPISDLVELYWKNEDLASNVAPYASGDPDGDGTLSSADADAFDAAVQ